MRMNRMKRPLGRSSEGVAADLLYAKSNESEEKAPRFHCETWATRTSRIRRDQRARVARGGKCLRRTRFHHISAPVTNRTAGAKPRMVQIGRDAQPILPK